MKKWLLVRKNQLKLGCFILVVFIVYLMIAHRAAMFINIHLGEAGVLWKRFDEGTQTNEVYNKGLHIINPFNRMSIYKIDEQHYSHDFEAITKDGLKITLKIFIRYSLQEDNLPSLHKSVGISYFSCLLLPEIESFSRNIIASYTAQDINKSQASMIQTLEAMLLGRETANYLKMFELSVSEIKLTDQ